MGALDNFLTRFNDLIPQDWQAATPEFIVLMFALLAPLVGIRNPDRAGMQQFTLIGLAGAFVVTLGSVLEWQGGFLDLRYVGRDIGGVFVVDQASQLLKLVFLFVALVAVLGVGRPLRGKTEEDWGEFFSLLMFATLGMMVVASARELFLLFLGIETASLASYLLAGFRRDREGAEAGLKYFVIGAIASGMTLFAISLLYGMAGSTNLADIRAAVAEGGGFDVASTIPIVLLLGGLGFKISAVPFHAWAPDVYCGGPVPLAGVLASASKAMGFAAIFHVFLLGLTDVSANWELAVALLAVASMFFGNLVAIQQTSVRRMLAYSSIAQAGYLLIALAVAGAQSDAGLGAYALGGGYFHLMMNAAMKLGAFVIVGALLWAGIPDHIDGWKGLGKRAPFLAFGMLVFLLSMAGIPPLGGFWSKFVLFSSAIDAHVVRDLGWLTWLAVFAVINSAISLFYYLRVIRAMYVQDGESSERLPVSPGTIAAVGLCMAVLLFAGFAPQWFIEVSQKAAASLLSP